MIPYVGCEFARAHLDAFIDDELSLAEQVAVESHLRWCRTCAARVEDLRLIGDSIRTGSPVQMVAHERRDVSAVHASVLMRIRTERELSIGTRLRDMFADMRLFWPALGATAAVLFCVSGALGVLQLASRERPESLARMIDSLSNPGTERNPLRPGNTASVNPYFGRYMDSNRSGGISLPRLREGTVFEEMADQDAMFAVAAVVSADGRVSNYELLSSERMGEREKPVHATEIARMRDVVRQSRFEPAQTSLGRTVAVNMVWLMVVTNVQTPPAAVRSSTVRVTPVVRPPAAIAPPESVGDPPLKRSEVALESTTA
ncbi:MAG TPA: zf-HC2 domain-containing protein [Vicinamibacterales bacterium]|nr:zf-HC2 domain-containing protein [Vicinamibacterales bacterium]